MLLRSESEIRVIPELRLRREKQKKKRGPGSYVTPAVHVNSPMAMKGKNRPWDHKPMCDFTLDWEEGTLNGDFHFDNTSGVMGT